MKMRLNPQNVWLIPSGKTGEISTFQCLSQLSSSHVRDLRLCSHQGRRVISGRAERTFTSECGTSIAETADRPVDKATHSGRNFG